jgi:integrase
MPRTLNKLSALAVSKLTQVGRYADGGGLYLQISRWRTKAWIFRYRFGPKDRHHGIGPYPLISLAEARQKAEDLRRVRLRGEDPIAMAEAAKRVQAAPTFREIAEAYIANHEAGWTNAKHAGQWRATLTTYCYPTIGNLPVSAIGAEHVLGILKPIWSEKIETASRLRGRIEKVLDAARAAGHRNGMDNPAQWGHLRHFLPAKARVQHIEHMPAMPYGDLPAFMCQLQARGDLDALLLQFVILTCCRVGEATGAAWPEIDRAERVWNVPSTRMKMKRPHRQPLSDPAMEVLARLPRLNGCDFLFPGAREGRPVGITTCNQLLKAMGRGSVTAHGMRATFKTWATERTEFPREIVEMALAHKVGDAVERAYQRSDMFEKRARLMDAWANFCLGVCTSKESAAFERALATSINRRAI